MTVLDDRKVVYTFWNDELDEKLVKTASAQGIDPYDLIRLAVEEYLGGPEEEGGDAR